MDGGAWRATGRGVEESDPTERLTHTQCLLSTYSAPVRSHSTWGGVGTVTLANLQLRELPHREVK